MIVVVSLTAYHCDNMDCTASSQQRIWTFEVQVTWGVQVVRYPNFFFSGMEADRNVKVVGGDVAVL